MITDINIAINNNLIIITTMIISVKTDWCPYRHYYAIINTIMFNTRP